MENDNADTPPAAPDTSARDALINSSGPVGDDAVAPAAAPDTSGLPAAQPDAQPDVSAPPPVVPPQTPAVDWQKRYSDSRRNEGKLRQQLATLQRQRTAPQPQRQPAQQQHADQPPPASQQNDWYGYGSPEMYDLACKQRPNEVNNRVIRAGMEGNADYVRELIREENEKTLAPQREQAFLDHLNAQGTDFLASYPELNDRSSPVTQAWGQWMAENVFWGDDQQNESNMRALSDALPSVNISEMCFKMSHYDVLKQENTALKAKLAGNAQRAVVALPSGGRAVAKGSSHSAIAEQIIEEARQNGTRIDPEEVYAQQRAMERAMPNFGKRKPA